MSGYATELVPIDSLIPHPRNYRSHPEDQLAHIQASITKHGMYRNVVVARDNTILAGHGVTLAAKALGWTELPVYRVDLAPDDVQALEILTGDNELDHLGVTDDRALTELLREIGESDPLALLGTGYDELMLASLLMVTRPAAELNAKQQEGEWVGMPSFTKPETPLRIIVSFRDASKRDEFVAKLGISLAGQHGHGSGSQSISIWYPTEERDDSVSIRFRDTE